ALSLQVLELQRDHGLRVALDAVTALRQELSTSTRMTEVSEELLASLHAALAVLPEVEPRSLRLNAEEPYRLKATCVQQKLLNTRAGEPAENGRAYAGVDGLLDDLVLLRDSLVAHRGEYVAHGRLERAT